MLRQVVSRQERIAKATWQTAMRWSQTVVDRMVDVNIRAPYRAALEAARRRNDNGWIILIESVNGDRMPSIGEAAYAMTEAAVQGIVGGLARDFGTGHCRQQHAT